MSEFKLSEKRKLQYSTQMSQGEGYFDEKDIKEAIKNLKKELKEKCFRTRMTNGVLKSVLLEENIDKVFEENIGDLK